MRNDLGLCLPILLRALGWDGDTRHMVEALPYFGGDFDITGLRRALVELGFSSTLKSVFASEIPDRDFPCLFLPDELDACVLLERGSDGLHLFAPGHGIQVVTDLPPGTAVFFHVIVDLRQKRPL